MRIPQRSPTLGTFKSVLDKSAIFVVTAGVLVLGTGGLFLNRFVLVPAMSYEAAEQALDGLVKLRRGNGSLPLRYLESFDQARVTRSPFDDISAGEQEINLILREAVERSPQPDTLLALGIYLLDIAQLAEAQRVIERALKVEPDLARANNALAVIYYARAEREPDQRFSHLQKGLALLRNAEGADPENLMVWYNFGMFYEALKMEQPAIHAWARYLEGDPGTEWGDEAIRHLKQLGAVP